MSQTMKLSEAIRLGAMLRPQGFGDYAVCARTCALGAATEAMSVSIEVVKEQGMLCTFPDWEEVLQYVCVCPGTDCLTVSKHSIVGITQEIVVNLNDCHRWTREQIADWVQTIEAQLEQSSSEAKAEQEVEQYA